MKYINEDWEKLKNLLLGTDRALGHLVNNYQNITIGDLGERLQNVESLLEECVNRYIAQAENED